MLPVVCPTCGSMLGGVNVMCIKDLESALRSALEKGKTGKAEMVETKRAAMIEIARKYTRKDNYCCKMRVICAMDIVNLIK